MCCSVNDGDAVSSSYTHQHVVSLFLPIAAQAGGRDENRKLFRTVSSNRPAALPL